MTHTKRPHKHRDMMKAYADDSSLCVFVNLTHHEKWKITQNPAFFVNCEYFLCLPKHKEACLHWLNGGRIQWCDDLLAWTDKDNYTDDLESQEFFFGNGFMLDDNKFRIKPKKVKRFVVIHRGDLASCLFESHVDIKNCYRSEYNELQIFPIEIEV